MNRFPAHSLKKLPANDRIEGLFGAMTAAGQTGLPSLLDSASALLSQTDPIMPSTGRTRRDFVSGWLLAGMRIGMGMPLTAAARATLLEGVRTIDRGQSEGRRDASVPYMVYLETRDPAFADIAHRWSSPTSNGYPELQALVALRRGDTAVAERSLRLSRRSTRSNAPRWA